MDKGKYKKQNRKIKMKISDIFTKQKSDEGVLIEIPFIKEKATLTIYGCDGNFFKEQLRQNRIDQAQVLGLPLKEQDAAKHELDLVLVAKTIKSWSFAEECNLENKIKLLRNSPGVFDLVNYATFDRSLFIG